MWLETGTDVQPRLQCAYRVGMKVYLAEFVVNLNRNCEGHFQP